jgi:hypothetical protein
MKARSTITKLIAITIAVAMLAAAGLLCGAGWLQPVEAQGGDGSVRFVSYTPIGIAHGQRVRLSVGNTEESATNRFVYMYYTTTSPSGVPLYESERIQVPAGGFSFSDVSREDLNTEGEPRTGRVQMMVRVEIEAPSGSKPSDVIVSVETIEEATGRSSGLREMILMGITR